MPHSLGLQVKSDQIDHPREAGGGLLIPGGYAPELLDLGEVVFDEMAFGVEVDVIPQSHFGECERCGMTGWIPAEVR